MYLWLLSYGNGRVKSLQQRQLQNVKVKKHPKYLFLLSTYYLALLGKSLLTFTTSCLFLLKHIEMTWLCFGCLFWSLDSPRKFLVDLWDSLIPGNQRLNPLSTKTKFCVANVPAIQSSNFFPVYNSAMLSIYLNRKITYIVWGKFLKLFTSYD